jgi:hypothetical protein
MKWGDWNRAGVNKVLDSITIRYSRTPAILCLVTGSTIVTTLVFTGRRKIGLGDWGSSIFYLD